jgi:sarcosine oxidase
MGLAAADELARRGHDVTVFERDRVGGRGGSSWGAARIFRLAYDHPGYVAGSAEARALWQRLEEETGEELIVPTGGLDYGDPDVLGKVAAALEASGVAYELLSEDAARERWPALRLEGEILFQADAGVIRAAVAIEALRRRLQDRGVTVREGAQVSQVAPGSDRVEVTAADRASAFDAAVVAVGSWSADLVGPLIGLPPLVIREEFPLEFEVEGSERMPVAFHCGETPVPAYGMYWLPGGPGVMKVGAHCSGRVLTDLDHRVADAPPELVDAIGEYARRTFPGCDGVPRSTATGCLYDLTVDENFIIERRERMVVLAGFSGHGFKFAPLIGTIAADLIEGDQRTRELLPPSRHLNA